VKKNEHWEIVRPLQARGDDEKIRRSAGQCDQRSDSGIRFDDRGDLHAYGLSEPRGSITIYGPNEKEGRTLQIGSAAEKIKDAVYGRFLPRNAVYALAKKTEDVLNVRPNDLRDRHLARIDTNNLDRVNLESTGQPKIVLARKEQNWTIASRSNTPANSDEVRRLIDTLNDQQVARFVADTATELPKYWPRPAAVAPHIQLLRFGKHRRDRRRRTSIPQPLPRKSRGQRSLCAGR
jgi:hypothetical protein